MKIKTSNRGFALKSSPGFISILEFYLHSSTFCDKTAEETKSDLKLSLALQTQVFNLIAEASLTKLKMTLQSPKYNHACISTRRGASEKRGNNNE